MKTIQKFIFALIITITALISHACPNDFKASGSITLNKQDFKKIDISGRFKADSIQALESTNISGDTNISNSNLNSLTVSGYSKLHHNTINGNVTLSGGGILTQNTINSDNFVCSGDINSNKNTYVAAIKQSGNFKSMNDTFKNTFIISGNLDAIKSSFLKQIDISSEKSTFKNSQIDSSLINNSNNKKTPVITLINTQIKGDVSFTKTKGEIILIGNSKIHGTIKNAAVKKR